MPSSSEQRKKRIGSITAALFVLFYVLPLVIGSVFAAVAFIRDGECLAAILFLLIYGVLGGAVVVGVVLALRQRLREIKGGEEDDASQYYTPPGCPAGCCDLHGCPGVHRRRAAVGPPTGRCARGCLPVAAGPCYCRPGGHRPHLDQFSYQTERN